MASSCYELTGLGYLGVDIVLDKEHGPLMLELNARPGLNIQIANREGGLKRYRTIEARFKENGKESTLDKVNFCRKEFAR
nr:sugar-transfer associated ATP-grasp domain-containing protein [Legionella pneumophila]